MKTSNPPDNNSHVFISEELQDRIDTNQLFDKVDKKDLGAEAEAASDRSNEYSDQATFIFSKQAFPCVYRLAAWQSDTVTVVVPPPHLERFFDLREECAEMILFGKNFLCVDSFARKKDGDWLVTIFLRS